MILCVCSFIFESIGWSFASLDLDLPESFTSPYFVFDPPRESSSNVLLAGEESCVFPDDRGTRLNEMEVASFSVSPDRVNASDSDSGETRHLHGMVHRNMDSLDLSLSPIAETCEVQECQLESMTASSVVESAHPSSSSLHSSIPDVSEDWEVSCSCLSFPFLLHFSPSYCHFVENALTV